MSDEPTALSQGEKPLPRSYLYVPGTAAERLAKARGRGSDAVIVDWEDTVPEGSKQSARAVTSLWAKEMTATDTAVWIRVNAGAELRTDLNAVSAMPNVTGVILAKVNGPEDVAGSAEILDNAGRPDLLICPLIETALALQTVPAIASHPRSYRLHVGEYDLAADLGVAAADSSTVLVWARATIVTASAAAGLIAPVGPVSSEIVDMEVFHASSRTLAEQGFVGRACIHPRQVSIANDVFSPDEQSVEAARLLVSAFESTLRDGSAVFVDNQGRMVDMAIVRNAQRVLALSDPRHY